MSCADFAREVIDACATSSKVVECTLLLWDEPVVKLRADLAGVRSSMCSTTRIRARFLLPGSRQISASLV